MRIRTPARLAELYAGPEHPIDPASPELGFMKAVCAGDTGKALGFFCEKKLFGGCPSAVDAPFGRYEGLEGIRRFAEDWLGIFRAESATVVPVVQTRANGRTVTEMEVHFETEEGIDQVPMFVVGDLRTADTLDEIRIYCHHTFVPGLQAYRKPIFPSAHLEMGDPGLLTGAVREYYEALHHVPSVDVERILGCMGEGCRFGGYEPPRPGRAPAVTREGLRREYEHMKSYIPRCVGMRYETIIDDGKTCVIEWVHIVSRAGQEERNRIALSGIAAYERGADGLLTAIRISDYAGYENTIDWTKTPLSKEEAQAINFVEEFPAGVGRKGQS